MTAKGEEVRAPATGNWTSGLPLKISGIVFWGMALVGLLFSVLILRHHERQIIEHHALIADHFTYQLETRLRELGTVDAGLVRRAARSLLSALDVPAAVVHFHAEAIVLGSPGAGLTANERAIYLFSEEPPILVTLYQHDLGAALADRRKRLLVGLGAGFLLFGIVLQWILKKLLSEPFAQMVSTAQAVSAGDTRVRFDESRDDEFGFLARFANRALEYVVLQREELREVLQRVRESEAELFKEKERAEVTLHSIGDAVITTDASGYVQYLNPVAERLTGWPAHEVKARPVTDVVPLIDQETRVALENPVATCLREGQICEIPGHALLVRRNGEEVAIADSAAPIRDHEGELVGVVMVFHDVGHARKLANQLSYQASHDSLTGLYNRREFELHLQDAIRSARSEDGHHVLCYVDLDQFKVVNDTCGHVAGDELLRQLCEILVAHVRDSDILARLGGDEFGVLLKSCALEQGIRIAEDLRKKIKDFRFLWEGNSFEVGASIGMVAIGASCEGLTELLSAADVACYAAKDAGRNRLHVFEPDDGTMQQRRGEMQWVSRINRAIAEDRLCLYYQPIVPLLRDDLSHNRFEVMVQLVDEDGGLVPPMAFIPAAERYNIMPNVDRSVIRKTFSTLRRKTAGVESWSCTINLSGQSLCDDQFLNFVVDQLLQSQIGPEHVCFEITETAAIANMTRAMHFINVLRGMGCKFALDDFGSGLSSFGYLKNLKVDYLKIDGSFVRDMVDDPMDHALVESINQIGHVLGIATVAEFVENEAILEALRKIEVDYAQGYWLSLPRPLEKLDLVNPDSWMSGSGGGSLSA